MYNLKKKKLKAVTKKMCKKKSYQEQLENNLNKYRTTGSKT